MILKGFRMITMYNINVHIIIKRAIKTALAVKVTPFTPIDTKKITLADIHKITENVVT